MLFATRSRLREVLQFAERKNHTAESRIRVGIPIEKRIESTDPVASIIRDSEEVSPVAAYSIAELSCKSGHIILRVSVLPCYTGRHITYAVREHPFTLSRSPLIPRRVSRERRRTLALSGSRKRRKSMSNAATVWSFIIVALRGGISFLARAKLVGRD